MEEMLGMVLFLLRKSLKYHTEGNVIASSNPFVVLIPSDDQKTLILEEGELQQPEFHKDDGEVNRGSQETKPIFLETPSVDAIMQDIHKSPVGTISSPSYADVLKKKSVETSGSLEEDSIEKFTKKVGRKSRKEVKEE